MSDSCPNGTVEFIMPVTQSTYLMAQNILMTLNGLNFSSTDNLSPCGHNNLSDPCQNYLDENNQSAQKGFSTDVSGGLHHGIPLRVSEYVKLFYWVCYSIKTLNTELPHPSWIGFQESCFMGFY